MKIKLSLFELLEFSNNLNKLVDMITKTRVNRAGFSVGNEYQEVAVKLKKVTEDNDGFISLELKEIKNEN